MNTARDARAALEAAQREAQQAADELAERYEEINLLYAIGEILGRTVSLDEAASIILREVAETVSARRGILAVSDPVTRRLRTVARRGVGEQALDTILIDDASSVLARAYRERHATSLAASAPRGDAERALTGALLAVPIMWTSPGGPDALGVLALSDRGERHVFSAGDQKLVMAISAQIGAAIENARLVRASVDQQRMSHEMELAHDLQMKLLGASDTLPAPTRAAARVAPAQSVGGDFYRLFRLADGRTGVMIGDVSGHGYQAALIMALAMSAAAIHAQRTMDPAAVLHALLDSLREQLRETDMYLTLCYAVVDPRNEQLRYANLGHPHAFVVRANGTVDRLLAHEPPLGLDTTSPAESTALPWRPQKDLLVLFTDGVSDARDAADSKLGERRVLDAIVARRSNAPDEIVDAVIDLVEAHEGSVPRRDDVTMVVVRA
jgi:sigma-B regulation protein RsbU (phosphoserine phosphatase)